MGRVAGPHGIKGWLKVVPFTEHVDALAAFPTWWMEQEGRWVAVPVEHAEAQGRHLVAQIAECRSREAAAEWRGAHIAVNREDMPAPPPGEYYWTDLEGARVTNARGEPLGEIVEVFSNGAHDILRVHDTAADGERVERLIPFVPDVVLSVSLPERSVRVAWERDW